MSAEPIFEVRDLTVEYGGKPAIEDISLDIGRNRITALIGPSGCGKSTMIRCFNRMNDLIPAAQRRAASIIYHGQDLYGPRGRPGRGAQADRDGVPEAEPVPEVDLRQHRLRPARDRDEGQHGRDRRAGAEASGALGRGQGPAEGQRLLALGRPAAAALHRALPRRRARRDPDGRAVLGARPDRDGADRGPDAGAEGRLLDRDRHPQHAAGRARVGHDRGADAGRRATATARWGGSSSTPRPTRSSPTPRASAPRTTSPEGWVERCHRSGRVPRAARGAGGGGHLHRRPRPRRCWTRRSRRSTTNDAELAPMVVDGRRSRSTAATWRPTRGSSACSRARPPWRATCDWWRPCCTRSSTSSGSATCA